MWNDILDGSVNIAVPAMYQDGWGIHARGKALAYCPEEGEQVLGGLGAAKVRPVLHVTLPDSVSNCALGGWDRQVSWLSASGC